MTKNEIQEQDEGLELAKRMAEEEEGVSRRPDASQAGLSWILRLSGPSIWVLLCWLFSSTIRYLKKHDSASNTFPPPTKFLFSTMSSGSLPLFPPFISLLIMLA